MKQWLRRGMALVLAALTLVTVAAASDGSETRGGSAAKWLLQWSLGDWLPADGLSLPAMLALYQSPTLLAAHSEVSAAPQEAPEAPQPPEPAEADTPAVSAPLPVTPRTALAFQDNGVPSQTVNITNKAGYTVVRGICIKNGSNKTLVEMVMGTSRRRWSM